MRRKHVLLIGGRDHNVDKVTTFGLRYSMVQVPELVTERHSRGARQYAVLDYRHIETLLPCVRAWHAQDSFDAVVSFTEYGLEPASRCALDLGVPGDNLRAVLQTRDKTRTRDLLNRHAQVASAKGCTSSRRPPSSASGGAGPARWPTVTSWPRST
jgi:hypothetical protein